MQGHQGRAIPLLPLWAVRPVQSLSACTRVTFTFTFCLIIFYYRSFSCLKNYVIFVSDLVTILVHSISYVITDILSCKNKIFVIQNTKFYSVRFQRISIQGKCRIKNAPIYEHGTRVLYFEKQECVFLKNKFSLPSKLYLLLNYNII
jgi:hypothetical protein